MPRWQRWLIVIAGALVVGAMLVYRQRTRGLISLIRGEIHMGTLVEITIVGQTGDPLKEWLSASRQRMV